MHRPTAADRILPTTRYKTQKIRYIIFLRDVFLISITSFGGAQAHLGIFLKRLVTRHRYLTEEELLELYALCQILPGPTSTQTISAVGYQLGGAKLAYLTLLIWVAPAVTFMTLASVLFSVFQANNLSLDFTKYIQPMAVAFVTYAGLVLSSKVIQNKMSLGILGLSGVTAFWFQYPFVPPIILILAGVYTGLRFKHNYKGRPIKKPVPQWANFILWAGIFVGVAIAGHFTGLRPIKLLENFYRNGSLVFGGGQVLVPLMHTEFVTFKQYLTSEEFLSGYALSQSLPGPTFSFVAFIGGLSLRDMGVGGQLLGSLIASLGIFLPGTFLIFFIIRFWTQLKQYPLIKAALEGVHAASAGLVGAAAISLFQPIEINTLNASLIIGTFFLLAFTKTPYPLIILAGLLLGILW